MRGREREEGLVVVEGVELALARVVGGGSGHGRGDDGWGLAAAHEQRDLSGLADRRRLLLLLFLEKEIYL